MVRRSTYIVALGLIVAVAVVAIAIAINFYRRAGIEEIPPLYQKVVAYAYRDTITGIDPSLEDDTGIVVLHLVYETLLRYDPRRGTYEHVLAKSVERIDDLTWRITLRDDAVFHDGSPVTAYDVNFSIWRTKLLYESLGRGLGYIWECLEGIEVVNEKTLNVKTAYPCDIRVSLAASYGAFIYSRKVLELSGVHDMLSEELINWFNRGNAIGSGPYRLVKYKPESDVVLEKFDGWWGWRVIGNPSPPDRIHIKIVEDPGEQERLLRTGHIDIASSVPRASLSLLKSEGFDLKVIDTFHNFILMFNTRRCPTNISEVRKAIAYAIPWDKIVDQALMGYGRKGSGLIPYGFPGYSKEWELKQDLEKARELLSHVHVPCDLKLTMVITTKYEEEEVFAVMLKEELGKLGIELRIEALPWEQVKSRGQDVWSNPGSAPHLIINDWWPTYMIPYDYFSLLECLEPEEEIFNLWNWAGYCNKEFDSALAEAYEASLRSLDESLRLYRYVQRIVFEDMPAVNLWDMQHIYVYRSNELVVRDEVFNPLYTYVAFLQYVEVKK